MKRTPLHLMPWALTGLMAGLLALPLAAEESPDAAALLRAALEKDAIRSQRLFETDKARANLAALAETSLATVSLSSGQLLASLPESGGSISAAPSIGLALGSPWNTSLSLGASFGYDLAAATFDPPKPTLSLTQPLGDLLWGEKPALDESSARKALADAEAALASREAAVTQTLYGAIRAAVQADYLLAQAEYARGLAARALETAVAAKSATEGSATLAKLRLDLQAADSSLRAKRRAKAAALDTLEALTGLRSPTPPLPPDPGAVAAPDPASAGATLAVAAARRRLELVALQTQSETEPDTPSLDAVLSAGKASSDYASGSWDYAGRLVFSHEGFQATAGGGMISRSSGGRTTSAPYLSATIGWKQRDAKQLAYTDTAALAGLAAAKAELAAAEASARTDLAAIAEEAATLADEATLAEPRAAYAAVLLAEKERARAAGLIDDAELAAARWERDRLDYENDLARCDRAVLAAKIAALFPRSIAP